MRLAAGLAVLVLVAGMPGAAFAQALPATLRSAGVTEAQISQRDSLIRAQAARLNLREDAVRTLAIEIFEAQPGRSFETYLQLIRDGSLRLPQAIAAARALDPSGDAALADLQRRAISAAESGRLGEALALQDEYNERYGAAVERAMEAPMLQRAAGLATAGEFAYSRADYLGAAVRYAQAAEVAPARATDVRWRYRTQQARALAEHGVVFAEPQALRDAVQLYRDVVLPLAQREARPDDWAQTQGDLGLALSSQGASGVPGALEQAEAAFQAGLMVRTQESNPTGWAVLQMNLGNALLLQAQRGDSVVLLDRVFAAYDAADTVITRESDPIRWADLQANLGAALVLVDQRSGRVGVLWNAIRAYEASLTVRTHDADPIGWARSQAGLGDARRLAGDEDEQAAAAYGAALTVITRETNPAQWARIQMNLGNLLIGLRRSFWNHNLRGQTLEALDRALVNFEAALTVMTREADPANWASIQASCGFAHYLQTRLGAPDALERAGAAYDSSLTVRTREADLAGWAQSMYGLARVYDAMGRSGDARTAAEAALDAFEQTDQRSESQGAVVFLRSLPQQ